MCPEADSTLSRRDRLWLAGFLAVALLLAMACSSCTPSQIPDDVPTMSDPAVAKLVKVVNGEEAGYCTVFKVGDNLAMTAGHCCGSDEEQDPLMKLLGDLDEDKAPEMIAYFAQGSHAISGEGFEVLVDDDTHDVCVMRGKLQGAVLSLAKSDPAIGARVWTAGFPKTHFLISDGHWSGRDEDGDGTASVAVWGGASGSPVLDSDNRVIGVLRAFYPPMSNYSIIAPIEWLRIDLAQARVKQ